MPGVTVVVAVVRGRVARSEGRGRAAVKGREGYP